ncbi:MAG: nucleoside deaminase [Oscillospiraceae bacterium]
MSKDEEYMRMALLQAKLAFDEGEVPVGAVIVKNSQVIALGRNSRESQNSPLGHAEINAITLACEKLSSWRLDDCEIYVTLEPCPMCGGAIINSRIKRLVYGAYDAKQGCFGSVCDLSAMKFPNVPLVKSAVLESDCLNVLKTFFENLRKNDKRC